jgi:hypothetical protein
MADAPDVKNPPPHAPDNIVGDTVDEVETPFVQPPGRGPVELPSLYVDVPSHVPAGPDTDFQPPRAHVPDGVVGDHPSEVFTPQEPPPPHVPDGVVGDSLDEVRSLYVDVPPHAPDHVVGDVLDEVETPYVDVAPHSPDNVVGDTLDEVPQPPALDLPAPPWEPVDVPTTPAPPPLEVTDDSYGGPGEPPGPPTGVHTPAGPLPADEPVRASPPADASFPAPLPEPVPHSPPSYAELLERLRSLDERLAAEVSVKGDDPYSEGGGAYAYAGSRALDPRLYARWLRDYLKSVGIGGTLEFVAVQSALHALNEKYGRVFNVGYLAMRFPILNSTTTVALDVSPRVHSDAVSIDEQLLPTTRRPETDATGRMADGTTITIREFNVHDADRPYDEGSPLNFGGVVDAALLGELPADDPLASTEAGKFLVDVDMGAGGNNVSRKMVSFSRLFQPDGVRLRPGVARVRENQTLARSSYGWRGSRGVVPAAFTAEDDRFGYVMEKIPDDVAYMPLAFIDLRPMRGGALRHVYFRALNVKSGENLNPSWDEGNYFGRVDPVVGYQHTVRELQVSFACHAFSPEDLPVIYKKRAWLSSMVYPEVTADSLIKSGPVLRMRVGDLYSNSRGGLAGVLRSVSYDDSEQVWELKNGLRVPMGFAVNVTFLVLHEGTPGILDGHFTVSRLVRGSSAPGETVDTSPAENDPSLFSTIMPRRRE